MQSIDSYIIPLENASEALSDLYIEVYNRVLKSESIKILVEFLNVIPEGSYLYVEYPYVEKYYRNSYYHFFSTKNADYNRNSIRCAVFSSKIIDKDFRDKKKNSTLQDLFLGVFTIIPTQPNIIGWSLLSNKIHSINKPKAKICNSKYKFLVNGKKLKVYGFPYISQDQEHIRCAEISVLNILDYFSNAYQYYSIAMPSDLYEILKDDSSERQIPTTGLTINDVSFVLKKYGLRTVVYNQSDEKSYESPVEVSNIIGYYVDSGLPIIVALEGTTEAISIGNVENFHTVIFCGRVEIEKIPDDFNFEPLKDDISIDSTEYNTLYIMMDDLRPPVAYAQIGTRSRAVPDEQIKKDESGNGEMVTKSLSIKAVIVPLPQKVYLEAGKAKLYTDGMLSSLQEVYDDFEFKESKPVSKLFLTSSKSFKNHINNLDVNIQVKDYFTNISTPKFLWINEYTDKTGKVVALLIIDATESKDAPAMEDLLIFACSTNAYYGTNPLTTEIINVPLHPVMEGYIPFDNYKD